MIVRNLRKIVLSSIVSFSKEHMFRDEDIVSMNEDNGWSVMIDGTECDVRLNAYDIEEVLVLMRA